MKMNEPRGVFAMTDDEYVALAESHAVWQEIRASWALEGIVTTRDNAIVAGRMISGEISLAEAIAEIKAKHGLAARAEEIPMVETVH